MFNGELIDSLPVDSTFHHTQEQLQIADLIFHKHQGTLEAVMHELKEGVLIAFLFVLFSYPGSDEYLVKFFPVLGKSNIQLLLVKAIMVVIVFYFIKNFALARRSA